MLQLEPDECRVLGVLVEKAHTTPQQYPLTLNALINGCNQKNNRFPETNLTEDDVLAAVDGMRAKALVREAMLSGSRVAKYRHNAREVLAVETPELVILTELMLRGPQTLGELRGRASRMHDLGTLDQVHDTVRGLMQRAEPYVKEIGPEQGSRANRFVQLLCPTLHRFDTSSRPTTEGARPLHSSGGGGGGGGAGHKDDLEQRVDELERTVEQLRQQLQQLAGLASSAKAD